MEKPKYTFSDCHNHLVDFLQETDGIHACLAQMNRAGVDHSMISGLMVMKKWEENSPSRPAYYLSDDAECYWYSSTDLIVATELLKLKEAERKRFHPFICGFNPTDKNGIDHVKRMIHLFPNFWHGIGEIFARHDDLTALTYGETARANHPALDPIYAFAAQQNLPIILHSNITSVGEQNPIYLHEVDEALKNHKQTKFIWCHCGISRRIHVAHLIMHLEKMIQSHQNLFMDLSWVFYDYLVQNGKVNQEWIEFLSQFPNRFMIGSDQVGRFTNYKEILDKYHLVLDALSRETAQKIAETNFLNLLPQSQPSAG